VRAIGDSKSLHWQRASGAGMVCEQFPLCGFGLSGDKRKEHWAFLQWKSLMQGC
jgi:hypothetical protein